MDVPFPRLTDMLSPEVRLTAKAPPAFIVEADDGMNPENSVFLYPALKRAGVPAERCAEWMRSQGFLKAKVP